MDWKESLGVILLFLFLAIWYVSVFATNVESIGDLALQAIVVVVLLGALFVLWRRGWAISGSFTSNWMDMMKVEHFVVIGAVILVSGAFLDSATTMVALANPLFMGQFVEVGNIFIKFLMYDLNLGPMGFYLGDLMTWALEILMIVVAYSKVRSYRDDSSDTVFGALFLMVLLGLGHWVAALQNIMLLRTVMYPL